jgi:hypothetical protein
MVIFKMLWLGQFQVDFGFGVAAALLQQSGAEGIIMTPWFITPRCAFAPHCFDLV